MGGSCKCSLKPIHWLSWWSHPIHGIATLRLQELGAQSSSLGRPAMGRRKGTEEGSKLLVRCGYVFFFLLSRHNLKCCTVRSGVEYFVESTGAPFYVNPSLETITYSAWRSHRKTAGISTRCNFLRAIDGVLQMFWLPWSLKVSVTWVCHLYLCRFQKML
jgi:hypothetical protein